MNDSLLAVSIIGGAAVLLSYAFLYYDSDAEKAWGGIEEGLYRSLWVASTGLTTACYLFLWACYVFFIEEQSLILLYSWLVFLISASSSVCCFFSASNFASNSCFLLLAWVRSCLLDCLAS